MFAANPETFDQSLIVILSLRMGYVIGNWSRLKNWGFWFFAIYLLVRTQPFTRIDTKGWHEVPSHIGKFSAFITTTDNWYCLLITLGELTSITPYDRFMFSILRAISSSSSSSLLLSSTSSSSDECMGGRSFGPTMKHEICRYPVTVFGSSGWNVPTHIL